MEEDNDIEQENMISINSDMWETLISTLKKTNNNNNSALELIFKMVVKNLTFDDPGLFSLKSSNIGHDRNRLDVCNTWLFNQLLYILLNERVAKTRPFNKKLQKDMLSASLIKQPWFFEKVIKIFVNQLDFLNTIKFPIKEPIEINFLHMDNHNEPTCDFLLIKLKTESDYNILYDNTIELLTYSIPFFSIFEKEFQRNCYSSVLTGFLNLNLKTKINCLNYFLVLLKQPLEFDESFKYCLINLVGGISAIYEQFLLIIIDENPQSKSDDNDDEEDNNADINSLQNRDYLITKFKKLTRIFIKKIINLNHIFLKDENFKIQITNILINILVVLLENKKCSNLFFEIIKFFKKYHIICDKLQIFKNYFNDCPRIVEVLEYSILNDVKINETDIDYNLSESSVLWKQLLNNLYDSIQQNKQDTFFKLTFLLKSTINIDYNFQLSHKNKNLYFFEDKSKFNNIVNNFLEIVDKQLDDNNINNNLYQIDNIIQIASYFLSISDFHNINEDSKIKLIKIILLPYNNNIINNHKYKLNYNFENIIDFNLQKISMNSISLILSTSYINFEPSFYNTIDEIITSILNSYTKYNFELINIIINNLIVGLIIKNHNVNSIFVNYFSILYEHFCFILSENLKNLFCLLYNYNSIKIYKVLKDDLCYDFKILCDLCDKENSIENCIGILINENIDEEILLSNNNILDPYLERIYNLIESEETEVRINMIKCLPSLFYHTNYIYDEDKWTNLFLNNNVKIIIIFSNHIHLIIAALENNTTKPNILNNSIQLCLQKLLKSINLALEAKDKLLQTQILKLISKFSQCSQLNEEDFFYCFRLTFFLTVCFDSLCAREACIVASEMCFKRSILPMSLLYSFKTNITTLLVSLAVHSFLNANIKLMRSINGATKVLGFLGSKEFMMKHYKLVVAILLPFYVKYPSVEQLLKEVSQVIEKELPETLGNSFLTIYPYLYVNESTDISKACLEYVKENTGTSLYCLLYADIKKTVAEILVYYHKSPDCVLRAFDSIIKKNENNPATSEPVIMYKEMRQYIADRFLGVLAFFETSLLNSETERPVKKEMLLSLGEIMRFLGSRHITAFRFKILATLKTAATVELKELKPICVTNWTIFIHIVDIQALGPLLSTIFVSLEPLLKVDEHEINAIAKYLIISNENLLSLHISDLFFIEDTDFDDEIKTVVKQQTNRLNNENFLSKLSSLMKHINHENSEVRVYVLKHLKQLFSKNRIELNHLIVGQNTMNPILENLLDNLILGCKHIDENLQMAAGECLGELGAIEPSLLPTNYTPQFKFALSIHTDLFAMMALGELCRAYAFQKDTKYVDNFSLAIQEILIEREVCLRTKKKLDVWEAIPERLRPLMEPLLTSCYTDFRKNTNIKIHPIFGSSRCRSHEEWAVLWIIKMIEFIEEDATKNLLMSFRPSIKRSTNVLSKFLPYVLLHSLQYSNIENQNFIFEELNLVFNSVLSDDESSPFNQMPNRYRGIKTIYFVNKKIESSNEEQDDKHTDVGIKCAKLGFNQLDFLSQWLRQYSKIYFRDDANKDYSNVETFVRKFDKKLMAKANYKCNEYARALLYLESFIEENPSERLQHELSFLAEIYSELMDPDSLEGCMCLKITEPTLTEQILVNNITGRLQESALCFERLQLNNMKQEQMIDIMQCYIGLAQPATALLMVDGILNKIEEKNIYLLIQESRAEALWQLSRFDELDKLISNPAMSNRPNWSVNCGQLLLNIKKNELLEFQKIIHTTKLNVLQMLRVAGIEQNSYQKGYPNVMKLHFINEFESIQEILNNIEQLYDAPDSVKILNKLFDNWELRQELLQPTSKMMEPLLNLRRIILREFKFLINKNCHNLKVKTNLIQAIDEHVGKLWVKSTKLARKSGMLQQAQLYIMNAESYNNKELFIEKAKLFWKKGDQSRTFKILERGVAEFEQIGDIKSLSKPDRRICANAKLLIALYNAESMNMETNTNLKYFKEAVQCSQDYEKSLVHLANYLDRIYTALSEEDQQKDKGVEMLQEIMFFYGKSMLFGCNYVHQSMPKMLSIWLDYTAKMKKCDEYRKQCEKMNRSAEKFCELLPPFMFFTAFSQLVSRICHPSSEVYNVLKTILVKLILNFPQQSLWMISSVFKSSYPNRVKRCSEVLQDKRLSQPHIQSLISDFNSLVERLIELTNKPIPKQEKHPTVSSLVPSLQLLFSNSMFSEIILPIQKHMLPSLPPICKRDDPASSFNSFPNRMVYIKGIREEMTVLISLQRPRKVTFIGDDGNDYIVMMKPKDDLRKDFRLMEFNAVVKEYLHQDPDARERRLNIRTYAVIPLNEECGIIEWLPNLQAFRTIVVFIYKQRGKIMTTNELIAAKCASKDPISKKRDIYLNTLLPRHPPVFTEWFKQQFTTPHNWYQARSSYIKTTAVMSIVGYILGLGDRHGENVLFDATNGDTVHVDFNCLFNKGESFEYPEKVPFRLTHNMVHAMGPLGIEGLYRRCCEITLKILREQTPTLMSILKPFVYDPLVTWSRSSKTDKNLERTDAQAMTNVNQIEERLKGFVKINGRTVNMPLSAEGQVNSIILDATSIDNLASMYIGWGPYL